MKYYLIIGIVSMTSLLGACANGIESTPIAGRQISPEEAIPPGYKTYTLFLNTSYDTAKEYSESKAELDKQFADFGEVIGKDNYAVWVYDEGGVNLAKPKDWFLFLTSLPKVYSNAWFNTGLSCDNGPYIAVMDQHPDFVREYSKNVHAQSTRNDDMPMVILIGLRGLEPRNIENFLQQLAVSVRQGKMEPAAIITDESRIRFEQSVSTVISMIRNNADTIIPVIVGILGRRPVQ